MQPFGDDMSTPELPRTPDKPECRLCRLSDDLRESHIIPSFVFKWLKKTSATGYLRFGEEMQRRRQDGVKIPMLCGNCEQRLSSWERQFSENVFMPLTRGDGFAPFDYGPWLTNFAVSLSWRALTFMPTMAPLTHVPPQHSARLDDAAETWRRFLLDDQHPITPFDQHLVPLGFLDSHTIPSLPPNINRYIARSVAIDVVTSNEQIFVFTKLPFALIIGILYTARPGEWVGTKLDPPGGHFGRGKKLGLPGSLLTYMCDKASRISSLNNTLSAKQQQVIKSSASKDADRTANSGTFEAMLQDVRLFGDEAFKKPDPSS
jgi:hypothetical protein